MTDEQEVYRDVLPEGFELHWYEVQSVLGRGAFGVTYLARDKNLDQLVAIKEYFPNDFSARETGYTVHPTTGKNKEMYQWGLDRFIREARTLAKFKHPNIVRVLSVFEHNNTAYMVMEYERGDELSKLFKEQGTFSEQQLLDVFLPVIEGLKLIHDAGFIHRDIKPSNIYIREDGSPVLIDFGSARQVAGAPTRALTSLVTYGYAPFEQYNESEEKQGPWTDIYALGASLFSGLVGKLPVDALTRGSSMLSTGIDPYQPLSVMLEGKHSAPFLLAIDHALLFHANERPQDVMVWADMLNGKVDVPELPSIQRRQPPQEGDANTTVVLTKQPSVQYEPTPDVPQEKIKETPPAEASNQPSQAELIKRLLAKPKLIASVAILSVVLVVGISLVPDDEETTVAVSEPAPTPVEEPIKEPVVDPVDQLLSQAKQARASGNHITPEGDNALNFYLQVLDIEPANQQADEGINAIIEFYSDGIRSDLAEAYFDKAEKNLNLLLAARPNSETLLTLKEELQAAQADQSELNQLLAQAEAYLEQNSFVSPKGKNALVVYRKVLEMDPENLVAIKGIETIASHYIQQAEKGITARNFSAAKESVGNVALTNPGHPKLNELQAKLKTAQAKYQSQINGLLSQARQALDANRLVSPSRSSAFYLYNQVLKLDARNAKSKRGIELVKAKLNVQLDGYIKTQNSVKAESLVKTVEKTMPRTRFAKSMRDKWEQSRKVEKPDMQIVEEMIGSFKKAVESRNKTAVEEMSEFSPGRKSFLNQFIANYRSCNLKISNVRFIGKEKKGLADIKIENLVNIQGQSIQPGAWSRFPIEIKKNKNGHWKIVW